MWFDACARGANWCFLGIPKYAIINLKINYFKDSKSKRGGKGQGLIQSSTTPDPGYHIGN